MKTIEVRHQHQGREQVRAGGARRGIKAGLPAMNHKAFGPVLNHKPGWW